MSSHTHTHTHERAIPLPVSCASRVWREQKEAFLDMHMMVSDPSQWVSDFANAGADSYTFHYEAAADPLQLIHQIRAHHMKVGVAIKPKTDWQKVVDLAPLVDMILVMTVEPGFGGQKFMDDMMPKVRAKRSHLTDPRPPLPCDLLTLSWCTSPTRETGDGIAHAFPESEHSSRRRCGRTNGAQMRSRRCQRDCERFGRVWVERWRAESDGGYEADRQYGVGGGVAAAAAVGCESARTARGRHRWGVAATGSCGSGEWE